MGAQGKAGEALSRQVVRYEGELAAQALAMEAMAEEREAAKVAMQVGGMYTSCDYESSIR